jgi:hypothetical protein
MDSVVRIFNAILGDIQSEEKCAPSRPTCPPSVCSLSICLHSRYTTWALFRPSKPLFPHFLSYSGSIQAKKMCAPMRSHSPLSHADIPHTPAFFPPHPFFSLSHYLFLSASSRCPPARPLESCVCSCLNAVLEVRDLMSRHTSGPLPPAHVKSLGVLCVSWVYSSGFDPAVSETKEHTQQGRAQRDAGLYDHCGHGDVPPYQYTHTRTHTHTHTHTHRLRWPR